MTAHIKNKGIYLALVSQLTIWRYYEAMKRFCRYLAEQYHLQKLENISGKHFTNYVLWMQESGKSASTVKPIWRLFGFFMTR